MPGFEETRSQYMGFASEIPIHTNCRVEPLISHLMPASSYFPRIKSRIDAIPAAGDGRFIYIAGWWLGPDFSLNGVGGSPTLIDLLKAKSQQGVDVRVLGWVMAPEVLRHSAVQSLGGSILNLNSETMRFINSLRADGTLVNKSVLNILSHPAGAVHMKMAIVGTGTQTYGFTGGLDFESFRHNVLWHDVQAEVTGPVVQGLFDTFRLMWNEVRGRSAVSLQAGSVTSFSHSLAMPDLPARTVPSTATDRMHVQSVRTFPQYRTASTGFLGSVTGNSLPSNSPLSFAPNGSFEIKRAWQKAIEGARSLIYMEDQAATAWEIYDWLNAAIKANSDLKIAILAGGEDPTAPNPAELSKALIMGVNNHLLAGLTSAQRDRIALFKHKNPRKMIHTKSTLIDDQWAMIGSANFMRRSLYTDLEHSVCFMDENGVAVRNYRADLIGTHLQATVPDLNACISRLFSIPLAGSTAATTSVETIVRLQLPLATQTLTADEQVMIDEVYDCDSRQEWGKKLIDLYMRQQGVGSMSP